MWETCPRFLHGSAWPGIEPRICDTLVRRSTSKPPSHLNLLINGPIPGSCIKIVTLGAKWISAFCYNAFCARKWIGYRSYYFIRGFLGLSFVNFVTVASRFLVLTLNKQHVARQHVAGRHVACYRQHVARPCNMLPVNMLPWCKRGCRRREWCRRRQNCL